MQDKPAINQGGINCEWILIQKDTSCEQFIIIPAIPRQESQYLDLSNTQAQLDADAQTSYSDSVRLNSHVNQEFQYR